MDIEKLVVHLQDIVMEDVVMIQEKKCKIGKLVTYQHGKSCFFEKVIKTWKRKVCCAFIRKCLDRKCSIVRRVCKVTSSRRRTKLGRRKLELRRRREEARLERKQKRSKHSCDCYKQELQNYRVLQAKRNRISKKYQKGRQHLENLREQLIINSSKSKKLRREIKISDERLLKSYHRLQAVSLKTKKTKSSNVKKKNRM